MARTPSAAKRSAAGSTRFRRRFRLAAAMLVFALPIVGCSGNFGAMTNQPYQPAEGISVRNPGGVYAINTLIVTDGKGHGTLISGLINHGDRDDTLVSVDAANEKGLPIKVSYKDKSVKLPQGELVQLAHSTPVRLHDPKLRPGYEVHVTLTFAHAAPVKVEVPIVRHDDEYATIPVGPRT